MAQVGCGCGCGREIPDSAMLALHWRFGYGGMTQKTVSLPAALCPKLLAETAYPADFLQAA